MAAGHRKLVWAPKARRDLIDIWKYFARVASQPVADGILRNIQQAVSHLEGRPFLGRSRNEIAVGLRSLLVPPHLVIYQVNETTIDIVRILHERQDFSAAFPKEPNP